MSDIREIEACIAYAKRQLRVTKQPVFVIRLDRGDDTGYEYDVVGEKDLENDWFEAFDGIVIEAFE